MCHGADPGFVFAQFCKVAVAKDAGAPHVLAAQNGDVTCCLISNYNLEPQTVELKYPDMAGKTIYCYELTDAEGFHLLNTWEAGETVTLECSADKVQWVVIGQENDPELNQYLFV